MTYNNIGQLTADVLGNAVTEQYGYDANRMQLTSQKAGTSSPYTNRMDLTYSYAATSGQMGSGSTAGNAGQLMSVNGTIGGLTESAAYTYDNLGRLVTSNQTSNGSSAQRRFAYDRWGSRTGVWDATSGGNQIQSISLSGSGGIPTNQIASVTTNPGSSTVNYSYDAAGNVTNDGAHTYQYDSENRIVNVDGGSTASYASDHQNRRYKKTIGSTVTHYVWQGSQVLAEHNGSTGSVLIDYVYSGSRMIAKIASGSAQYFLSDGLSTRLLLDAAGNVVGRQGHLPFGEDLGESGSQQKQHLTSYERDAESGVDYALNRTTSPQVGRFLQADPYSASGYMIDPQSWNRYAYVGNDPVNSIDPIGLLRRKKRKYIPEIDGPSTSGEPPSSERAPFDPFAVVLDDLNDKETDDPGTPPKIAPFPTDIRDSLRQMLMSNNNDCRKFAQGVIDQAAKDAGSSFSPGLDELIGLIAYIFEAPNVPGYPDAAGTARGSIAGGDARVIIAPRSEDEGTTDHGRRRNQYEYVETALHETLHLGAVSGTYSDPELAVAAVHLGGLSDADLKYFDSLDVGNKAQMSRFFDYVLQQHCPPPQ